MFRMETSRGPCKNNLIHTAASSLSHQGGGRGSISNDRPVLFPSRCEAAWRYRVSGCLGGARGLPFNRAARRVEEEEEEALGVGDRQPGKP